MLRAVYPEIKKISPDAIVVMGPLASENWFDEFNLDFLRDVVDSEKGAAIDAFDMASFNYYVFYRRVWEPYGTSVMGKAEWFRQQLAPTGKTKPLIVGESGAVQDDLITSDVQALLVPQVYTQALADSGRESGDGIVIQTWFTLHDFGTRDSQWGLLTADGSPKPAYQTFQRWTAELYGASLRRNESEPTFGTTAPEGAVLCDGSQVTPGYICNALQRYLFQTPSGRADRLVLWVDPGPKTPANYLRTSASRVVELPASEVLGVRDQFGAKVAYAATDGVVRLTVTESVLYVDLVHR
jgi:hypothetical protein